MAEGTLERDAAQEANDLEALACREKLTQRQGSHQKAPIPPYNGQYSYNMRDLHALERHLCLNNCSWLAYWLVPIFSWYILSFFGLCLTGLVEIDRLVDVAVRSKSRKKASLFSNQVSHCALVRGMEDTAPAAKLSRACFRIAAASVTSSCRNYFIELKKRAAKKDRILRIWKLPKIKHVWQGKEVNGVSEMWETRGSKKEMRLSWRCSCRYPRNACRSPAWACSGPAKPPGRGRSVGFRWTANETELIVRRFFQAFRCTIACPIASERPTLYFWSIAFLLADATDRTRFPSCFLSCACLRSTSRELADSTVTSIVISDCISGCNIYDMDRARLPASRAFRWRGNEYPASRCSGLVERKSSMQDTWLSPLKCDVSFQMLKGNSLKSLNRSTACPCVVSSLGKTLDSFSVGSSCMVVMAFNSLADAASSAHPCSALRLLVPLHQWPSEQKSSNMLPQFANTKQLPSSVEDILDDCKTEQSAAICEMSQGQGHASAPTLWTECQVISIKAVLSPHCIQVLFASHIFLKHVKKGGEKRQSYGYILQGAQGPKRKNRVGVGRSWAMRQCFEISANKLLVISSVGPSRGHPDLNISQEVHQARPHCHTNPAKIAATLRSK